MKWVGESMYRLILRFLSGLWSYSENEIYYKYKIPKLIDRGLTIGDNVYIDVKVIFDYLYPYLITIENNCRISEGTIILAHDATIFRLLGVTRLGKVKILNGTFIGANAIILPGCTIGPNALIAAGSVVNRDIGEGMIAAGNPARVYGKFEDLIDKYRKNLTRQISVFDKSQYRQGLISSQEILTALETEKWAYMEGDPDRGNARYGWF